MKGKPCLCWFLCLWNGLNGNRQAESSSSRLAGRRAAVAGRAGWAGGQPSAARAKQSELWTPHACSWHFQHIAMESEADKQWKIHFLPKNWEPFKINTFGPLPFDMQGSWTEKCPHGSKALVGRHLKTLSCSCQVLISLDRSFPSES